MTSQVGGATLGAEAWTGTAPRRGALFYVGSVWLLYCLQITAAILTGQITVPIAATFPIERIRDAVTLQAERHAHGKIVVTR